MAEMAGASGVTATWPGPVRPDHHLSEAPVAIGADLGTFGDNRRIGPPGGARARSCRQQIGVAFAMLAIGTGAGAATASRDAPTSTLPGRCMKAGAKVRQRCSYLDRDGRRPATRLAGRRRHGGDDVSAQMIDSVRAGTRRGPGYRLDAADVRQTGWLGTGRTLVEAGHRFASRSGNCRMQATRRHGGTRNTRSAPAIRPPAPRETHKAPPEYVYYRAASGPGNIALTAAAKH